MLSTISPNECVICGILIRANMVITNNTLVNKNKRCFCAQQSYSINLTFYWNQQFNQLHNILLCVIHFIKKSLFLCSLVTKELLRVYIVDNIIIFSSLKRWSYFTKWSQFHKKKTVINGYFHNKYGSYWPLAISILLWPCWLINGRPRHKESLQLLATLLQWSNSWGINVHLQRMLWKHQTTPTVHGHLFGNRDYVNNISLQRQTMVFIIYLATVDYNV